MGQLGNKEQHWEGLEYLTEKIKIKRSYKEKHKQVSPKG